MKKTGLCLIVLVFLSYASVMGQDAMSSKTSRRTSAENVNETIIENGLTIFTLEDYSNPLVRIEVNVRAGVSFQNAQNAGFFKLLSTLIEKSAKNKFDGVVCDADSTRFILNVSPSVLEEIFSDLADDIFNPIFSDALLKQEFSSLKREVLQNNNDSTYLINSSIDARVFANEPWKHDTGIYPSLFSKLTEDNARVLLNEIQTNFYTPQNTAIFVSGNFHSSEILNLIKNSFGRFYSNKKTNYIPLKTSAETKRKFVIHDKQFSEDFTQIVLQYVFFNHTEGEVAAAVLNDNSSNYKQTVSNLAELNILGEEYIDVAMANKTGCTRLIFQTLMQNSKTANPAEQSEKFLETTKQNTLISYDEFVSALSKNTYEYKKMISSSSNFMDMLSQFWAILPYEDFGNVDLPENYQSLVSYKLQNRNENLKNVNVASVQKIFQDESPFVFVIVNSKQFNKYKKDFEAKGFVEITSKNSSWYTQTLYKNMKSYSELLKTENQAQAQKTKIDFASDFYESNKASIFSSQLSNGINLCVKENPNTTGVTFVISIDGGNLRFADDYGFEEVMTNILTTNILRQIEKKRTENLIVNDYEIYSETKIDFSRIIIECDADDFVPIINACANALILDEVLPSDADMIVQGRRTRKRLENGSTVNQLYSAAINKVLPNSDYTKIFETEKDILENTTYEKILQAYPDLLDAARFSFVVSGNIESDKVKSQVEKVFSVLQNQELYKKFEGVLSSETQSQANFPTGKQQKVKLNHTFLTDVSAKDAGPMPSVLIPTKSFADPVLFCIKSPDFGSDDYFVFNSILPYLQNAMNDFATNRNDLFNCKISAAKSSAHIPMATLTFSSVEKTSAADNVYKSVLKNLKDDLSNISTSGQTLQKIKDTFVVSEFQDSLTNTGSALLIGEGIRETKFSRGAQNQNADYGTEYLENYLRVNSITVEEILDILNKYFLFNNLYRLYSSEGKK